jgi:hypothetical protein
VHSAKARGPSDGERPAKPIIPRPIPVVIGIVAYETQWIELWRIRVTSALGLFGLVPFVWVNLVHVKSKPKRARLARWTIHNHASP